MECLQNANASAISLNGNWGLCGVMDLHVRACPTVSWRMETVSDHLPVTRNVSGEEDIKKTILIVAFFW